MKNRPRVFRIGTRGSLLALTQSRRVLNDLKKKNPEHSFKLVVIKTTGDVYQSVELFKKNNIGVFTKEIESDLLRNNIDIAVHSLKDLPTEDVSGLCVGAVPRRLSAADVLISRKRYTLRTLPHNSIVATGSLRRKRQLHLARPDLDLRDLRGNLDTRVGRVLQKNDFDAVVLAHAGLLRLGKFSKNSVPIPLRDMMPAVGQAALGVQVRVSDAEALRVIGKIDHRPSRIAVTAERAFLATLHGGCRVPVGVTTKIVAGKIFMHARVFSVTTDYYLDQSVVGLSAEPAEAGRVLAVKLLKKGAAKLLKDARLQDRGL